MGLLKKAKDAFGEIEGIFSNNQIKEDIDDEINTEEQDKLVQMAIYDYEVFKEKRQPVQDVWRKEQRMYKGDQWYNLRPAQSDKYPDRMEFVGNLARSQIESIVARLTGWTPEPDFEPREAGDEQQAALLNEFIPYELNCIKFKPKHIRAVRRMVIHGSLIYKVIHDPSVNGGRGMNRYTGRNDIIALNFGSFFPDPAIKDFIYLQKARANIINNFTNTDYVKQRWPEQGKKVMPSNQSSDTEIFDEDSETSAGTSYSGEAGQTSVNVLEYWYKGKPKYMSDEDKKFFNEQAEELLAEGKDPSEALAKADGDMDGIHCLYVTTSRVFLEHKAYVFDHGQYPIVARTLYPEENNPWGAGYMRDMISPQTFLNKFCELAIEITAKMGNSAIMYGVGAGIGEAFKTIWKKLRSKAGGMLPVEDVNQVKELQGVAPNPAIMQYIQFFMELMQKIPGMFDSANGAANPNVTSGRQSEALINAAAGRLSLAAELIEDASQEVMEQFVELCAQFYTTERIVRITGKPLSFSRQSMLKAEQTEYEGMQVMEEYVPKFDIRVNIGVEKPRDREYWIQLAMTLLKTVDPQTGMPMIDAQAVEYTVQNGRMEPMSVINERMQVAQQQMQQMQQLQQQVEQLGAENQQLQQFAGAAQQQLEGANREKEVFGQQERVARFELDQERLDVERQKVLMNR
jgi:hypothetical protein